MSKEEQSRRQNTVNQAIANEKLEGFSVSKPAKKVAENYVAGKISVKEAAAKIRARYGANELR